MSKTLTAGQHELVFTQRVIHNMAKRSKFTKFVYQSILRFNRADWGGVQLSTWEANNVALESLNSGDTFGRILGEYTYTHYFRGNNLIKGYYPIRLWILRNAAKPDGTQVITVLYADEYSCIHYHGCDSRCLNGKRSCGCICTVCLSRHGTLQSKTTQIGRHERPLS